jgi:penicillin-binding protein 2
MSQNKTFTGGAGVIMDAGSGELLTSTSFPEYDSANFVFRKRHLHYQRISDRQEKSFLDRDISGLYTPGSIVKPFFALGALAEGIIDPNTKILSTGSISIPNPYFPNPKNRFQGLESKWLGKYDASDSGFLRRLFL